MYIHTAHIIISHCLALFILSLLPFLPLPSLPPPPPPQAIDDIGNLAMGKWQQMMVPNNQMADVMRVVKDAATSSLKQGSWVRIKRGLYRDDIAQVSSGCGYQWAWSVWV